MTYIYTIEEPVPPEWGIRVSFIRYIAHMRRKRRKKIVWCGAMVWWWVVVGIL